MTTEEPQVKLDDVLSSSLSNLLPWTEKAMIRSETSIEGGNLKYNWSVT
jgi:hypothetical protein